MVIPYTWQDALYIEPHHHPEPQPPVAIVVTKGSDVSMARWFSQNRNTEWGAFCNFEVLPYFHFYVTVLQ